MFIAHGQMETLNLNWFDSTNYTDYFKRRIDSINNADYYNRLQKNINIENIDSSTEATNLIFELYNSDSKKYSAKLLNPILKEIEAFNLNFFKKTIIGNWHSEGLGSDWFTTKIINPNKKFTFSETEAFFYINDSLVRQTSYSIIGKTERHLDLEYKRFRIFFSDTKEEWSFNFITKGHIVPSHTDAKKLYILFNKEPNCVCGCKEELYSIESNSISFLDNDRITKALPQFGRTVIFSTLFTILL